MYVKFPLKILNSDSYLYSLQALIEQLLLQMCAVKWVIPKFSFFFSSFSHVLFFSYLCQEYSSKKWGKEHLRDKTNSDNC